MKLTPASEIQARPAPWPTYPHCPACKRRPAKGQKAAAYTVCPHCGEPLNPSNTEDAEWAEHMLRSCEHGTELHLLKYGEQCNR